MSVVVQINNLSKSFGKNLAVKDLSLTIKEGQVYGILGPNGSGKTTTLSILMGICKQDNGSFEWFGEPLTTRTKERIGSLIETPNFYPHLSVQNNLEIVAHIKRVDLSDIDRVLDSVNLTERRTSRFSHLSLGMKQRLSIGALLLGDPDVLVLDEPTNGLDPQGIAEVRNVIRTEAQKNKTIILASHILDEVEKVCTHVAVLKKGTLLANGRVAELLGGEMQIILSTDRVSELSEVLIRSGLTKSVDQKDYDLIVVPEQGISPADINNYSFTKGFILSKIETRKKTLESEFLKLVK